MKNNRTHKEQFTMMVTASRVIKALRVKNSKVSVWG